MLRLQKNIAKSHADLLIDRYQRLRAWALQLTEHDPERAQELLQDFFVHFTVSHPELDSIQDLDSYLFVVMRNLHLSHVRSASRTSQRVLSIVEFDSAEVGLWAADTRDRIRMQDELRAVCRYACLRKESSKAGSVLILRFFHGYYPEEIARVLRVTRPSVKEHLRLARAEARVYLDDPERLTFLQDPEAAPAPKANVDQSAEDISSELRSAIFSCRLGECLTDRRLREIYDEEINTGPDCKTLAHIVSCSDCLDEVNAMLGLPLLASRNSIDTIGKDTRRKGGPGGGAPGGGPAKSFVGRYLRRAKQIIQHEPQELCVAVNGYLQGSQKVSSERNELTLVVDNSEAIGFVEVFSEQGIRLLLLNVDPLPGGAVKQTERVELSEGRTIDASLSFNTAWPTIHVLYHDPTLSAEYAVEPEAEKTALSFPSSAEEGTLLATKLPQQPKQMWRRVWRSLGDWSFWLRPGTITAVAALLLVAAMLTLLLHRAPDVPNRALEVLSQSRAAEQVQAAQPNQVLHRTLYMEEWIASQLRSRQRIELWQKGATEISARRVYDIDGRLQNGEWRRADGSHLLFNHGQKLRSAPARDPTAAPTSAEMWRASPSAQEFMALIASRGDGSGASSVQIEERPNAYLLSFADKSASSGLIEARVAISRSDLRAVGQTLVIREGGELREYRFTEAAYEREAVSDVAPSVFEPDPALLGGATRVVAPLEPLKATDANPSHAPATVPVASLELEVDVLRKLNQVNALSGEQIALTRTPAGQLRVQGIVDTEERKAEILRALASVKNDPAVVVEIETATAAAGRQKQTFGPAQPTSVESVTLDRTEALPVAPELRRYFAQRGISPSQVENEMEDFSKEMVARARTLRRDALALKQVAVRFSDSQLQQMDPARRAEWKEMIRARARRVAQEANSLLQDLGPIFPGLQAGGAKPDLSLDNEAGISRAADKLFGLTVGCEQSVNQSFSIYSTGSHDPPVKSAAFWRVLASVEQIADRISRF